MCDNNYIRLDLCVFKSNKSNENYEGWVMYYVTTNIK